MSDEELAAEIRLTNFFLTSQIQTFFIFNIVLSAPTYSDSSVTLQEFITSLIFNYFIFLCRQTDIVDSAQDYLNLEV